MTVPKRMNDFDEDLAWSHAQAKLPLWEETYRKAFPDFDSMTYVAKDGWAQRGGIDRRVHTTNGRTYDIDEKSRRDYWPAALPHRKYFKPHVTVFPDIALEYVSNDKTKAPGWIEKPLACDFLAYNILPLRQVYLLPMAQTQAVWQRYKWNWLEEFHWRPAKNRGYNTLFCPVPVPVLMRAVCEAMFFKHTWLDEYDQHVKRGADVTDDELPSSLDTLFEL